MIQLKRTAWAGASVAAIAIAAAGCTPATDPPSPPAAAAQAGEAGEAGEGGAEHGEAGVAEAYAGLEGEARAALRLQHLKGFILVAEQVLAAGDAPSAAALAGQGVLEVFDTAPDQFAGFDAGPLRASANAALDGGEAEALGTALQEARAAINARQDALDASGAMLASRMIDVSTGLYALVQTPQGVDAIEYQHSLGAALAAQDALARTAADHQGAHARALAEAEAELARFVALWPSPSAPETPAAAGAVLAQGSRAALALSALQD